MATQPKVPRRMPSSSRGATNHSAIASTLVRLFLVGCGLVLLATIGDILMLIGKVIGYAILAYVVCAWLFRGVFDGWPNWVIKPHTKIRTWLSW